MQEFGKTVKIWQSYCHGCGTPFFWDTVYIHTYMHADSQTDRQRDRHTDRTKIIYHAIHAASQVVNNYQVLQSAVVGFR